MAVTIDTDGAATYFAATAHVNSDLWNAFTDNQHTAAVAQAVRQLSRALGTELTSETVDTSRHYQPNYAAFEQALYLLANSDAVSNGEQTAPHYYGTEDDGEPRERKPLTAVCREARYWLDWGTGVGARVIRG